MYKQFKTNENFKAYTRARNQVKWALRKSVKEKETDLAKNIKNDPKAFYSYVSSKTKPKEGVSNLTKDNGSLTETDGEKAEILNSFFTSVFTEEDLANMPSFDKKSDTILTSVSVDEESIRKKLENLNVSKSCGPDGVHPRILKELCKELSFPLKILFDLTMTCGKIPSSWKTAEVKPIFKKGDKTKPGNYCPVSLTSIVCKIFEGLVRDQLNNHLLENKLLSPHQFGFTSGRSCITQLISTVNDWMQYLDNDEPVDAIYLDLQKAFDKVPHARLLTKLEGYGIQGNLLLWITDFLSERRQYVTVGTESSSEANVTSGVPQGSVLGPTLFIYFINDMPDVLDCMVKIFADDTKAYLPVTKPEQRLQLQENINKLLHWTNEWQIKFNSDKCKVLHLGKNNPRHVYNMGGNVLDATEVEKDLGVYIDEGLTYDHHISETVKKGNKLVGMITRFLINKDKEIMVPLFKSLARSVLEYGNVIWNPILRKHVNQVESVQQRFTKRVKGTKNMGYEERLRFLKLPSLEFRRLRGDMIETFKILHGFYDDDTTNSFFSLSSSVTRGHSLKLTKYSVNTNKFRHFFTNRIINNWNSLPQSVVASKSINCFKNGLDKHWKHIQFSINLHLDDAWT